MTSEQVCRIPPVIENHGVLLAEFDADIEHKA